MVTDDYPPSHPMETDISLTIAPWQISSSLNSERETFFFTLQLKQMENNFGSCQLRILDTELDFHIPVALWGCVLDFNQALKFRV